VCVCVSQSSSADTTDSTREGGSGGEEVSE
jgi:hypothetical protein